MIPAQEPAAWSRRQQAWLAGICVGTVALRAAYLWQLSATAFPEFVLGDSEIYDAWARQLAAGDWLGSGVFYQAPLYPYFLAILYATGGPSFLLVRSVQVVLAAGSCLLLARAGRELFSPRAGLLAALLLAVYPPAIFFDGLVHKPSLELFLFALVLALSARALRQGAAWRWAAVGAALGAVALARELALVLAVPLAAFAWWSGQPGPPLPRRGRALRAAALLAGVLAALLPVALRNRAVGGDWVLTTSAFGPSLFIGNSARATGFYIPLRPSRGHARFERQDATDLAQAAAGRTLTPSEVSAHWTRRTLDDVRGDPARWLGLLWRKWRLTWNAMEVGDTEDVYSYGEAVPILGALLRLLHFGVLAPLAAAGLVLSRRRRSAAFLATLAATYAGSVALFFVFARYRFPLVPFLLLLAAAGLDGLEEAWRERRAPRPWLAAAGAAAVAVFVNWPLLSLATVTSPTHFNLANHLAQAGRSEAAEREYREALRRDPAYLDARFNLALLLSGLGRGAEAEAAYRAVLASAPDHPGAHTNLGATLLAAGRAAEALEHLEAALRIAPSVEGAYNVAFALGEVGRAGEAEAALRAVLRADPDFFPALYRLARQLEPRRPDEALLLLLRAQRLRPGSAEVRQALQGLGASPR